MGCGRRVGGRPGGQAYVQAAGGQAAAAGGETAALRAVQLRY